jgi:enoyl-CoA hydratase/carnithine racemase
VVVLGKGAHFCAGGDISEYASFRFQEATLREFHEVDVWGGLNAMLACDVPIVAQIAGNCMGAGVEIASCCDIRIASSFARFGAPIARLGFPMAPREAALIARELGLVTARQMLLEAAVLDAPQMAARGFLTQVVADDDLAAQVHGTVQRMVSLAPQAARLNKQTIRALNGAPAQTNQAQPATDSVANNDSMATLLASAYQYADSAEHREGIAAFLEKRSPAF